MPEVRILRATRFTLNDRANLEYSDVVELEGPDGNPETWLRCLRREGHETPEGERTVWTHLTYQTYEQAVSGKRDFEMRTGHLTGEFPLQLCSTLEPGPSERDRRY